MTVRAHMAFPVTMLRSQSWRTEIAVHCVSFISVLRTTARIGIVWSVQWAGSCTLSSSTKRKALTTKGNPLRICPKFEHCTLTNLLLAEETGFDFRQGYQPPIWRVPGRHSDIQLYLVSTRRCELPWTLNICLHGVHSYALTFYL